MKLKKTLSLFTSLLMLLCLFSTINIKEVSAATTNYYVAPNGSDSNVGTSKTKPFKTIAKAVSQAKSVCAVSRLRDKDLQPVPCSGHLQ